MDFLQSLNLNLSILPCHVFIHDWTTYFLRRPLPMHERPSRANDPGAGIGTASNSGTKVKKIPASLSP